MHEGHDDGLNHDGLRTHDGHEDRRMANHDGIHTHQEAMKASSRSGVTMRRVVGIALLIGLASGGFVSIQGARPQAQAQSQPGHVQWVEQTLRKMQTVVTGMTRAQLLTVFTTEGGFYSGLRRTYVSRECPYFKVDVEFEAVGRSARDATGRLTAVESPADKIVSISRPYLQLSILD
jgi:hypothetical protein